MDYKTNCPTKSKFTVDIDLLANDKKMDNSALKIGQSKKNKMNYLYNRNIDQNISKVTIIHLNTSNADWATKKNELVTTTTY